MIKKRKKCLLSLPLQIASSNILFQLRSTLYNRGKKRQEEKVQFSGWIDIWNQLTAHQKLIVNILNRLYAKILPSKLKIAFCRQNKLDIKWPHRLKKKLKYFLFYFCPWTYHLSTLAVGQLKEIMGYPQRIKLQRGLYRMYTKGVKFFWNNFTKAKKFSFSHDYKIYFSQKSKMFPSNGG